MKYEVFIPDRFKITANDLVKILNENIDGAWYEAIIVEVKKGDGFDSG